MGKKKTTESSTKSKQSSQSKNTSTVKRHEISVLCAKLFRLCTDPILPTQLWENYLEIMTVLEEIKKLEKMKTKTTPRSTAIEQFMKWLIENDANVDGASIAEFPGYDLGLKAEKDLSENELVLEIPRKVIFSTETAALELSALKNDPLIQHMPQVALAIALLIERHKDNSKWKPYLNILPTDYCTVLYMTTDEMIELKGSPTLEAALRQCKNIARQYSHFSQMFQSNNTRVSKLLRDIFTYEEYRWAVSTVMTRQNIIPGKNGTQMIHALIPMWDMCNHEEGMITTDFNINSDTCECYVKRPFKTGEQIFINYGKRTNADFFVHSGFVDRGNKNDGFPIRLGISKSDPLYHDRARLLKKLGLPSTNMSFLLKIQMKPIPDEMRAFLRVFCMDKYQLDYWLESDDVSDLHTEKRVLSESVEENVRNFLTTRLSLLLANYPTQIEEDHLLAFSETSPIKRMIIILRILEKHILYCAHLYARNEFPFAKKRTPS